MGFKGDLGVVGWWGVLTCSAVAAFASASSMACDAAAMSSFSSWCKGLGLGCRVECGEWRVEG